MEECLKWLGQCPRLMHMLAMLIILERQLSCLRMVLRCCHVSLSGPGADELLHLIIACLNSSIENSSHVVVVLNPISLRTSVLRWVPQGCCMDKGKGHDVNDRLRRSSISQRLM